MKTPEELTALREEVEAMNAKLAELSEEELAEVTGGNLPYDPQTKKLIPDTEPVKSTGGWEDPKYILG